MNQKDLFWHNDPTFLRAYASNTYFIVATPRATRYVVYRTCGNLPTDERWKGQRLDTFSIVHLDKLPKGTKFALLFDTPTLLKSFPDGVPGPDLGTSAEALNAELEKMVEEHKGVGQLGFYGRSGTFTEHQLPLAYCCGALPAVLCNYNDVTGCRETDIAIICQHCHRQSSSINNNIVRIAKGWNSGEGIIPESFKAQ